jgi:hypothetical protein
MHDILFQTVHGSRLYGLHHDESDYDYYTVVDKVKTRRAKYAKHSIVGDRDSVVVDFGTFVEQAKRGVPQALEAMFSRQAEVDRIEDFRKGFLVGTNDVYDRYLRTIKSFAFDEKDPYKRKRHALRLALNFSDMRAFGRFNPTLSKTEVDLISGLAHLDAQRVYDDALAIAWS